MHGETKIQSNASTRERIVIGIQHLQGWSDQDTVSGDTIVWPEVCSRGNPAHYQLQSHQPDGMGTSVPSTWRLGLGGQTHRREPRQVEPPANLGLGCSFTSVHSEASLGRSGNDPKWAVLGHRGIAPGHPELVWRRLSQSSLLAASVSGVRLQLSSTGAGV